MGIKNGAKSVPSSYPCAHPPDLWFGQPLPKDPETAPAGARTPSFPAGTDPMAELSPDFVADDLSQRRADVLWKIRFSKAPWPFLLFGLEAQARPDRHMPLRSADYRIRGQQETIRKAQVGPNGEVAPSLQVVLYNRESGCDPADPARACSA